MAFYFEVKHHNSLYSGSVRYCGLYHACFFSNVKSEVLNVEELPNNCWKETVDAEAVNIGLESKYQADCIRAFLWKRMMFIDPVSFS